MVLRLHEGLLLDWWHHELFGIHFWCLAALLDAINLAYVLVIFGIDILSLVDHGIPWQNVPRVGDSPLRQASQSGHVHVLLPDLRFGGHEGSLKTTAAYSRLFLFF